MNDPELLNRAMVQVNVRLPVRLRDRMERYLQGMDMPSQKRAPETEDWPDTMQGLVAQAVDEFLLTHKPEGRKGPDAKPPLTKQQKAKIKPAPEPRKPVKPKHPYRTDPNA